MVASVSCDRPLFTAADEALMLRIGAYFEALGFEIERDRSDTYDGYWMTPPGTINPAWIIVRQDNGAYELRDGLLTIERRGRSLRDILPPEWMPALAA
ncbi:hypothetical protein [Rhodospirillaceae bacterium SYSU D60014]|uniref:hypothetical protein n=1 Tax=Virgifigura deserti TaxID=2268457 RepID=UPI000E67476C